MSELDSEAHPSVSSNRTVQLGIAVAVGLLIATAFVSWFDYAAVTAVFHPSTDRSGHLLFQVPGYSNTVYPFTYVGVAASFLGVTYFVFSRERERSSRPLALLLAVLVANLASVGMVDGYEQVFVALMFLSPNLHFAGVYGVHLYWGTAGATAGTVGGLLLLLIVLPWSSRRNWPGVALCLAVTAIALGVWFLSGFAEPSSDSLLAYSMNALSRVASQLAIVAGVSRTDWVRRLAALWRVHARREVVESLPSPGGSPRVAGSRPGRLPRSPPSDPHDPR